MTTAGAISVVAPDQAIPGHLRASRKPEVVLPPGSCDTMFHIFDDPMKYPVHVKKGHHEPIIATLEAARRMHDSVGITRGVIVQASCYRTDHSLLLDALSADTQNRYRGMALIDDTLSARELQRLHDAGVRGARFNFGKTIGLWPSQDEFRRSIARIAELGWYAKVFVWYGELLDLADELKMLRLPVILDHFGGLAFSKGVDQPAFKFALELLRRDNWWMMLSNADRWSASGPPWSDAIPFAQAFYAAAPSRCLWGTDWPHAGYTMWPQPDPERVVPAAADLVELLARFLPDERALHQVLVDNPSRIFSFT